MNKDLATFEKDLGRLRPRALSASFRRRLYRLLELWRCAGNGGKVGQSVAFDRYRFEANN